MECYKCHGTLTSGDKYCPHCGAEIVMPPPIAPVKLYCSNCGEKLPESGTFCTRCGNELVRDNNAVHITEQDEKNKAVKNEVISLVNRAMQGDNSVWAEIYEKTHRYVYYMALKSLKSEQDAQDITQDVYIQLIQYIEQLKVADAFYGWLRSIIFSRCMNLMKKKKPVLIDDESGITPFEDIPEQNEEFLPESVLDNFETRRMILKIVDDLPDIQRQTVLFYYYDEMSVEQIASLMECAAGTVKSRLNYARQQIRKGVDEHERKGVKLYGIGAVPILAMLLKEQAGLLIVPEVIVGSISSITGIAVGAAASGAVGAGAGAAGGSAAVGVAVGGAAGGAAATVGVSTLTKVGIGLVAVAATCFISIGGVLVGGSFGSKTIPTPPLAQQLPQTPARPFIQTPTPTPFVNLSDVETNFYIIDYAKLLRCLEQDIKQYNASTDNMSVYLVDTNSNGYLDMLIDGYMSNVTRMCYDGNNINIRFDAHAGASGGIGIAYSEVTSTFACRFTAGSNAGGEDTFKEFYGMDWKNKGYSIITTPDTETWDYIDTYYIDGVEVSEFDFNLRNPKFSHQLLPPSDTDKVLSHFIACSDEQKPLLLEAYNEYAMSQEGYTGWSLVSDNDALSAVAQYYFIGCCVSEFSNSRLYLSDWYHPPDVNSTWHYAPPAYNQGLKGHSIVVIAEDVPGGIIFRTVDFNTL